MSRLPVLNLIFLLILITVLAIHHSATVLAPDKSALERVSYEPGGPNDGSWGAKVQIAVDYLGSLWGRALIIKQWTLEYRAASLTSMFAPRGAESDLAEARFHVANAEVFSSATGEIQKAETELDRADDYLQKAIPLVAAKLRPTLNAIRQEVSEAKLELQSADPESESDEQIKVDLDWAIAALHDKRL